MFQSTMKFMQKNEFKFFKKNDLIIFVQFLRSTNSTKMFIAYKRKDQKMKLNDICVSDDFKSNDDVTWKKNIIKKKKYFKDFTNQFFEFFISKFFELTKEARLKLEQIQRMQIKNELLKREKELLFEMLFNREIAFFWNFIEKDLIRSKVTSLMKIRTMSHEA
jgi:beta-N-acetylglucosaminidase